MSAEEPIKSIIPIETLKSILSTEASENLTKEMFSCEYSKLVKEKNVLSRECADLHRKKNSLSHEKDTLSRDCTELRREKSRLEGEITHLWCTSPIQGPLVSASPAPLYITSNWKTEAPAPFDVVQNYSSVISSHQILYCCFLYGDETQLYAYNYRFDSWSPLPPVPRVILRSNTVLPFLNSQGELEVFRCNATYISIKGRKMVSSGFSKHFQGSEDTYADYT